jgi:hypothetical protein
MPPGNYFHPIDLDRFALRTLRELKLLIYLSKAGVSENVRWCNYWGVSSLRINLLDHISPRYHQTILPRKFQGSLASHSSYLLNTGSHPRRDRTSTVVIDRHLPFCRMTYNFRSDPRTYGNRHASGHKNPRLIR